jgi:hypothetical protein
MSRLSISAVAPVKPIESSAHPQHRPPTPFPDGPTHEPHH